jgi:hypothetical protein
MSNFFFQMRIMIEIFILKTTMYHKYTVHTKNTKKKLKYATIVYA